LGAGKEAFEILPYFCLGCGGIDVVEFLFLVEGKRFKVLDNGFLHTSLTFKSMCPLPRGKNPSRSSRL